MNSQAAPPSSGPGILTRDDGATIAYHHRSGKSPGVVFLTGFKSDMTGSKALAVDELCRELGQSFLRFDYFGHGESSGAFEDGTIGRWADDAVNVIDHLTQGPQVLVGSSMGGWIMLLATLRRPDRVAGLIGLAAAPDFTEDLLLSEFTTEQKAAMERDGRVEIPNCYDDEPYIISRALIDDGNNHLLLRGEIAIDSPIRLIHGLKDEDVPWETSRTISERVRTRDVEVTFVKEGDHRLSEPHDLIRLKRTLTGLLEALGGD